MTALNVKLRIAIARSKLPDKAIISAIEDAAKPKPVTLAGSELQQAVITRETVSHRDNGKTVYRYEVEPRKKRTYRRRDMRAE